jgi:hypothetical protein
MQVVYARCAGPYVPHFATATGAVGRLEPHSNLAGDNQMAAAVALNPCRNSLRPQALFMLFPRSRIQTLDTPKCLPSQTQPPGLQPRDPGKVAESMGFPLARK